MAMLPWCEKLVHKLTVAQLWVLQNEIKKELSTRAVSDNVPKKVITDLRKKLKVLQSYIEQRYPVAVKVTIPSMYCLRMLPSLWIRSLNVIQFSCKTP